MLDSKPAYNFDPNATYIISGGLGACGRVIAQWMVGRGVKYMVLLSRSGSEAALADFLESLREMGARVETPLCDVSDKLCLKQTLAQVAQTMPPIKGCIHAATVIKVSVFVLLE